jgi:hypothetical protein
MTSTLTEKQENRLSCEMRGKQSHERGSFELINSSSTKCDSKGAPDEALLPVNQ